MKKLEFLKDSNQKGLFNWSWTYCHGELEGDNGHDIGLFNQPKPDMEGIYSGIANGKDIIVILARKDGILEGRLGYASDEQAMNDIYSTKNWK